MSSVSRVALALSVLLSLPAAARAVPIVDFSDKSAGGAITSLGASTTLLGVTAYAYYFDPVADTWLPSTLIARDEMNDHGLGVCSEVVGDCLIDEDGGGGDNNELSQLEYWELIVLEKPDDMIWTGIYLSSLDGNSGNTQLGNENGAFAWANTLNLADFFIPNSGGSEFNYPGAFGEGVVEGALGLPVGFINTSKYLLFTPVGQVGANNDFLVWGVDVVRNPELDPAVPEPASLILLGTGLAAIARSRRRPAR